MKLAVIISPNYKDYAKNYLADCLHSLRQQTLKDFKLFLVDNESSEESLAYLKSLATEAEIIPLKKNEGFAGGNDAALAKVLASGFDYAFLINMDATAETDCLEKLIKVATSHPTAAAIQARIMLWPEKDLLNSLGNETHFLGFGYCRAYREPFDSKTDNVIRQICYASGAGVLLRLSALKQVGLFDEALWMYNEDQDLCLRLWLAGWQSIIAPEAVIYHKYEFDRSIAKYYWMDRNRLIVIFKHYRLLTLIAIAPALFIMELGLLLFSFQGGWFIKKLKVWAYFLWPFNWAYLIRARRQTQRLRVISDRKLSVFISGQIWYQEVDDFKLRLINPIFSLYWKAVRLIMFW